MEGKDIAALILFTLGTAPLLTPIILICIEKVFNDDN